MVEYISVRIRAPSSLTVLFMVLSPDAEWLSLFYVIDAIHKNMSERAGADAKRGVTDIISLRKDKEGSILVSHNYGFGIFYVCISKARVSWL